MKARVVLIMVGLVGLSLPLVAATIHVTTTDPAVAADGQCSLIEAIINANNDSVTYADCSAGSGPDTIELASSATYELDQSYVSFYGPNGLPIIRSAITIDGQDSTIKRATGAPVFRLMVVNNMGTLTLRDLTLEGGDSGGTYCGGALLNAFGSVEIYRTTVTRSTAPNGGGICNSSGPMTLTGCEVVSNIAMGEGGGIHSVSETGPVSLTLKRTSVSNNLSEYAGGIAAYDTELNISDSTFEANEAFSDTGYAFCGGVGVIRGDVEIVRSTIRDNIVESLADLSGFGGGICIVDTAATIRNSTISGNEARGAATAGSATTGRGGGIMALGGAWGAPPTVDTFLLIEDSTICDNTAETYGGGISANRFAGEMAVTIELRNTIVAENLEQGAAVLGNCVEESPAVITSSDFNLADDSTCNLIGTDDLVVADVMLAPIADNGGLTWTHLIEAGSPAIDSGDDAVCPATDQLGQARPWDGDGNGSAHCDRGAVEHLAPFFIDGFETGDTIAWSNTVP